MIEIFVVVVVVGLFACLWITASKVWFTFFFTRNKQFVRFIYCYYFYMKIEQRIRDRLFSSSILFSIFCTHNFWLYNKLIKIMFEYQIERKTNKFILIFDSHDYLHMGLGRIAQIDSEQWIRCWSGKFKPFFYL